MGLPWVRLDSNIGSHDKVLRLLADPSAKRWQAFSSYIAALGWCGGHGTDGIVPKAALPMVHGNAATAKLLVTYGLWREHGVTGWEIPNYADRQQTSVVSEAKREAQSRAARKTNCIRYHGAQCGCWDTSQ